MRSYILLLLLLSSLSVFSQTSINNFKYVLIPETFSFFKQTDQYRLNSLTKSYLEANGFTAYFENAQLPTELANNKCNALRAELVERKSMFVTRLTLLLKDCKGTVVFKSKEGSSREKEFEPAYSLALKDAFTSLNEAKYSYQPLTALNEQPVESTIVPVSAPVVKPVVTEAPSPAGTLYAQPIANGYQLIDTTPKTVLRMYKSSVTDYFIAEKGSFGGIVFKRDGSWIFEYYKDGNLMAEKLLIKF